MAVGATTYVAAAALPMRSPAEPRLSIPKPRAATQAPGTTTPGKLDPATSRPIAIQFKDARLSAVLAFLGFATSVVFTGYDASFDEGRSVTIQAEAPLEELLDRLLTPSGLTYTVTGPRTIAIARNPLAECARPGDVGTCAPADQHGVSGVSAGCARARHSRDGHRRHHGECRWRCDDGRGCERSPGAARVGVQGGARTEIHEGHVHNGDEDRVRIPAHRHVLGREDRRCGAQHRPPVLGDTRR